MYFNGLIESWPVQCQFITEAILSCADLVPYDHEVLQVIVTLPCHQEHFKSVLYLHAIEFKHHIRRYIAVAVYQIFNACSTHLLSLIVTDLIGVPVSLPVGLLGKMCYTRYTPMYIAHVTSYP